MKHAILACAAAALLLPACGSDTPTTPGAAAAINAVSSISTVTAGTMAADSLVARVVDAKGRGVPSVAVSWLTVGPTFLSPTQVITDEKGYARTSFRSFGPAQDVNVVARALTTTGPQDAVFTVKVVAGPAVAMVGVPVGTLSLPLYGRRTLDVTAVDAYNNPAPTTLTSSNSSVVEAASGQVTAKAPGNATVTASAGALQASFPVAVESTILNESFDTENGGHAAISYHGFNRWTLGHGDVDLIGAGSEWDFVPGHGLYVDLDGYYSGGLFMTRDQFVLPAGSYTLTFKLAGSQRGDVNTVTVAAGSAFSEQFTLASGAPFTTVTRTITLAQPTTVRVSFDQPGADGFGLLLDDVSLTKN